MKKEIQSSRTVLTKKTVSTLNTNRQTPRSSNLGPYTPNNKINFNKQQPVPKTTKSKDTAKTLMLKKFSGYTPELPGDPMGLAGVELDAYPTLSSYYLGINMSF